MKAHYIHASLWREIFYGNHPLTVDEFLYCYKLSEISQSLGFYQFSTKGFSCRLVKSLPMSDRRWKTKFFFVLGLWARNLFKVVRDPFPPYTGEMGIFVQRVCYFSLLVLLSLLY